MCPYLASLGSYIPNLHFILFGLLATTSGVLNLSLPETNGRPLPETMEDLLEMLEDRSGSKSPKRLSSNGYKLLNREPDSDVEKNT